ncbi:DNA repair protein RecO [Leuconostocaceae bacterium ESL0958]|nr:DNA repair protein RecO [Leuconostocaceae bacterium ESL0958]
MALIEGLILYTRPYREHDLLIRLLTKERGTLTVLARGAKKVQSPLAAATQPYTWVVYEGAWPKEGQGLGFVNSVQDSRYYRRLTTDLTSSAYAALQAKLVDTALEEGQAAPDWFDRLATALAKMDAGADPQVVTNIIELQLLPLFGVAPNWQADPINGAQSGLFDYSERYNGIIEQSNFHLDEHRLGLQPKTVYYLRLFSAIDLHKLGQINLSLATKRAIQRVIDYLYERQVGLMTKEKYFIQKMASWEAQVQIPKRKQQEES